MKTNKTWLALVTALAVIALAAIAAACGSDDEQSASTGTSTAEKTSGNAADAAFARDMEKHHLAAIEMARLAKQRGQHAEIKQLADDIIAAQEGEVATLKRLQTALPEHSPAHGESHSGMSDAEMGMDMNPAMLETAKPFDKAFIDMMVRHHQGAVTMAKDLQQKGENAELQEMADDIIDAQTKEIAQMREWRTAWYGSGDTDEHGEMHGA